MRRSLLPAALAALLTVAILPATSANAQQRDFSKVEIKPTRVAGNVYMLEGMGGNIGVSAGKDGTLIVDDQFAPLADKIRGALQGIDPGKLKFVLNTHWHGDHTGGNESFGGEATIVAHDNVRKRLSTGQNLRGEAVPPIQAVGWPVLTYAQSISIHWNGEEIKVIHLPNGHTDGDSVIWFTGSNVLHMGDDFFAGRFPFVDLESGGSVVGLTANIGKVLAMVPDDIKIIPGHGPLSTKADLQAYHRMLVETTAVVKKGMAAGKSLDALKKAGLPAEWKDWGGGFIKAEGWIEAIHESLSKKPAKK